MEFTIRLNRLFFMVGERSITNSKEPKYPYVDHLMGISIPCQASSLIFQ
jgi:hypothetical protein